MSEMSYNDYCVIRAHPAFRDVRAAVRGEIERGPNGETPVDLQVDAKLAEPSEDAPEREVEKLTAKVTAHRYNDLGPDREPDMKAIDCVGAELSGIGPFTADSPPEITTATQGSHGPPSLQSQHGNLRFKFTNNPVVIGGGLTGKFVLVVEIRDKTEGLLTEFISNHFSISPPPTSAAVIE